MDERKEGVCGGSMKYRKKPIVIDAEQFFPNNNMWPAGVIDLSEGNPVVTAGYGIMTLESLALVEPGDWIITGIRGEKYPCKPDIFDETYEKVDEQTKLS